MKNMFVQNYNILLIIHFNHLIAQITSLKQQDAYILQSKTEGKH